jgi:hypothetical protein
LEALAALEAWGPVAALRLSRWTYPAVSALHILGIALLVGAILPIDLRLLGLSRRGPDAAALATALVPVAAAGLALAAVTGAMLFAVSAREYAANPAFLAKLGLVALGALNALAFRRTGRGRRALAGAISLMAWLAALAAGRLIAFV